MEVQCSVLTLLHCLLSSHSPACLSNLYCSTLCCLLSPCCVSFVFIQAHHFLLHFLSNSDTPFSSHFSLSVRQGTFFFTAPPVHVFTAILHSLTLLNLELTFFTYMICDHAVIYKVSSAPLPQQSFFFLDVAGYLWVIKPVAAAAEGAFIPWHRCESAHVSVCCWLADPQSGPHSCSPRCPPAQFHASVLAFLCSLLPAESCGHLGFNTLAICPPALPLPHLKASISLLFLLNRA